MGLREHVGQVSILGSCCPCVQSLRVCGSEAIRLDPNSPDVITLRGLLMFLTAKTAQALSHASSALRLDPGHEPANKLRKRVRDVDRLKDDGNAAFKSGRLEEAIEKYTEALEVGIVRAAIVALMLTPACRGSDRKTPRARAVTYGRCFSPTAPQLS